MFILIDFLVCNYYIGLKSERECFVALTVDILRLLRGEAVEWERIDFRKNFHALSVLRSICAFANDINNSGGGYVIIGTEDNEQNLPVFPVYGLSPGQIVLIKRQLTQACKHISPPYYPIIDVVEIRDKQIVVIWVPAGANRPYQVPRNLSKPSHFAYYVRTKSALTRKPTPQEEIQLVSLANNVSFDDQIHHVAKVTDLNITLIQSYLAHVKSGLLNQIQKIAFTKLCQRMNIVGEVGAGFVRPKNVGILLFSHYPEKFIPGAYIKVIEFDSVGRSSEKLFTGPLFNQLDSILIYIKGTIITKLVEPVINAGISWEFYNYPFNAIKESILNAIYHRDYRENVPIEMRISSKGIEIISYPGPLPPLDNQKLKLGDVSARRHRNPCLGHFLKQMHLVQGLATGLDRIRFYMENNGNPAPTFETDKKRNYFKVFLPIHSKFLPQEPDLQTTKRPIKEIREIVQSLSIACPKLMDLKNVALILLLTQNPLNLNELMYKLSQSNKNRFLKEFIDPLIALNWLQCTLPNKPTSPKQQYILTNKGRAIIENAS